MIDQIWKAV